MKIVVALDKFKGSLDAPAACRIVRDACHAVHPDATVITKPMADGGDGTAAALVAALDGDWITLEVTGPLPGRPVLARYGWLPRDGTAIIEMAAASGLALLPPAEHDPLRTTTYGTGELIADACRRGARKILLGVGGSATVDGGVGAAMALGWQFLDAAGAPVGHGGGELERIARIMRPVETRTAPSPYPSGGGGRKTAPPSPGGGRGEGAVVPHAQPISHPEVRVLCDVDNPLCGPHGAAAVFGPQKGATPAQVDRLDAGLRHLAALVKAQLGRDILDVPGAGAAGGLAGGAIAFLNATLVPGIETVMTVTGLDEAVNGADWVITGEGRFDAQSLRGKVVSGVTNLARNHGAKVAVLAGSVELTPGEYEAAGISLALATKPAGMPLAEAIAQAEFLLAAKARELAECL